MIKYAVIHQGLPDFETKERKLTLGRHLYDNEAVAAEEAALAYRQNLPYRSMVITVEVPEKFR